MHIVLSLLLGLGPTFPGAASSSANPDDGVALEQAPNVFDGAEEQSPPAQADRPEAHAEGDGPVASHDGGAAPDASKPLPLRSRSHSGSPLMLPVVMMPRSGMTSSRALVATGYGLMGIGGLIGLFALALMIDSEPENPGAAAAAGIGLPLLFIGPGVAMVLVGNARARGPRPSTRLQLRSGRTRLGTRTVGMRMRF